MTIPIRNVPIYLPNLDFRWRLEAHKLREDTEFDEALLEIIDEADERAESFKEDLAEFDPVQAAEEFKLDLITARIKVYDPDWLKEKFGSYVFANALLVFCRKVEPSHEWEVVESDQHSVVANKDRTLVADFVLSHKLSAAASLLHAGDKTMEDVPGALEELTDYLEEEVRMNEWRISVAKGHLKKYGSKADVVPLHRDDNERP